jgi:Flp pilus assembly protein TadG
VSARLRGVLRRRPGTDDDRGAATIFVVGLAVMLLVVAGLVVDGGLAINARSTAFDIAEQAARAGARNVDEDTLRETDQVVVDEGEARADAADFLDQALAGKQNPNAGIQVNGNEVTVTVTYDVDTALLGLVGRQQFSVAAEATARAAVGIVDEIGGPP